MILYVRCYQIFNLFFKYSNCFHTYGTMWASDKSLVFFLRICVIESDKSTLTLAVETLKATRDMILELLKEQFLAFVACTGTDCQNIPLTITSHRPHMAWQTRMTHSYRDGTSRGVEENSVVKVLNVFPLHHQSDENVWWGLKKTHNSQ